VHRVDRPAHELLIDLTVVVSRLEAIDLGDGTNVEVGFDTLIDVGEGDSFVVSREVNKVVPLLEHLLAVLTVPAIEQSDDDIIVFNVLDQVVEHVGVGDSGSFEVIPPATSSGRGRRSLGSELDSHGEGDGTRYSERDFAKHLFIFKIINQTQLLSSIQLSSITQPIY